MRQRRDEACARKVSFYRDLLSELVGRVRFIEQIVCRNRTSLDRDGGVPFGIS